MSENDDQALLPEPANYKAATKALIENTMDQSQFTIEGGLGLFTTRGWDAFTTISYVTLVATGLLIVTIAMGSAGRGSDHPWLEYDETIHKAEAWDYIDEYDRVDIYFGDMNTTYREKVWSLFALVMVCGVSCIFMASTKSITSTNVTQEDLQTFRTMVITTTVICAVGLVGVLEPIHGAIDSENDESTGAHLSEFSVLNFNTSAAEYSALEGNFRSITLFHRDSWVMKMYTSGLIIILAAPFVTLFTRMFFFRRLRIANLTLQLLNGADPVETQLIKDRHYAANLEKKRELKYKAHRMHRELANTFAYAPTADDDDNNNKRSRE